MDLPDDDRCYDACLRRDARFDGWFVVGVTSTGIYCRPSCPAPVRPKRANVRFFPTAAAAQQAGFRTCKRCRPDTMPGSPEWDRRGDLVARAVRAIDDGVVDREGVPGLARRLGVSARHLGRVLQAELGAGPLQLARAGRAHRARVLLESTDLPVTDIAFAAGFGSIRQCNDTVREVFASTPGELRRRTGRGRQGGGRRDPGGGTTVHLRLALRPPIDATALLASLAGHAVPGVEEVVGGTYRRSLALPGGWGVVAARFRPDHVAVTVRLERLADLGAVVSRCRRLLDLDADPLGVLDALGPDAHLGALVRARPGRRSPGSVDGFEAVVRAIVGQQVSTAGARRLLGRLTEALGEPVPAAAPTAGDAGDAVHRRFPTAAAVAAADPALLPLPRVRATALVAVARQVAQGRLDLGPAADPAAVVASLAVVPGVGPWTIDVVRLRCLRDPDVLPVGDLAVRRGAAVLGLPTDAPALARAGLAWAPHRSVATEYLLGAGADPHPLGASADPHPLGAGADDHPLGVGAGHRTSLEER